MSIRSAYNKTWAIALGSMGTIGVASYYYGKSIGSMDTSAIREHPNDISYKVSSVSSLPSDEVASTVKPKEFYKYGFPGPIHDIRNSEEFVSCYNRQTKNPYWVLEHVTKDSIKNLGNVDRKHSVFKEDEAVPVMFRNTLKDFFRSGYDRGHNAPAADAKFSQNAMDETFYLTNMSPQVGEGFNRDYWAHFEDFVRRLTNKYESIRVMTGPLYLPKKTPDNKYVVSYEVIGSPPSVAVPTHFFKLIIGESTNSNKVVVGAFVLPNQRISNTTPLTSFQVPPEALERSSGLELLKRLPANRQLDLCKEVKCEIIVREFSNASKNSWILPGKKNS